MHKRILFIFVAIGITISCNNSQPKNSQSTSVIEQNKRNDETIDFPSDGQTQKDTSHPNENVPFLKQQQSTQNESSIFETNFYQQFEKKSQLFIVNNAKDTVLTCLEGTTIRIRSNTFVAEQTETPIAGDVKIAVTEYYKLSDMLLANLSTVSNHSLLETGGMLHITAISNNEKCKIKDGQKIEISFPTKAKKQDMQLFTGNWNQNNMNWKVVSSVELNQIVAEPDTPPQFPGGEEKMIQFIRKNINYPKKAKDLRIQGIVYIRFIIDRDGHCKDPFVWRGIDPECDKEALNIVSKFPKFKPAQFKGESVNTTYTLNVNFSLDGNTTTKNEEIKQDFEKKYNDANLHTLPPNYITSYLFSTSDLGWINCDRFIKDKREKIDFFVKLDEKAESDVKVIFHSIKSIMYSLPKNDTHVFRQIPQGEKITIVAIKNIHHKPHLAIKETIVTNQLESDFTFYPITMETLKAEMKKIDQLHP